MGWILSLLLSGSILFADSYFTPLRFDESLPKNCEEMKIGYFGQLPNKFYVGRKGALKMGFTFEYPLERQNATLLWNYFRGLVKGEVDQKLEKHILRDPQLKAHYKIIMRNFEDQGFDFQSEGEVLEVLAIEKLYNEFPENQYFITGGINYHEEGAPQTIGEIDVFVGNRQTCEAVAIGEVKLGKKKTLTKARKQLARFDEFLDSHGSSGLGSNYYPKSGHLREPRLPSSDDYQ